MTLGRIRDMDTDMEGKQYVDTYIGKQLVSACGFTGG
jgi:hypothetical protein